MTWLRLPLFINLVIFKKGHNIRPILQAGALFVHLQPPGGDVVQAFQQYQRARYLRTGRVQLTARFYGDIYHAAGVQRALRNQMFQGGLESAGFAGLKWMYDGIDPDQLFN